MILLNMSSLLKPMDTQLRLSFSIFQIRKQDLLYSVIRNQKSLYHLSTNYKLFISDSNKKTCKTNLFIDQTSLKKSTNNYLLMGQSVSPVLLRSQIQSSRNYSTQVDPGFFSSKVNGFWNAIINSTEVELMQNALIWLHTHTGMSWWATIFASAFILRTFVSLPCLIYMKKLHLRMDGIKKYLDSVSEKMYLDVNHEASMNKWSANYTSRVFRFRINKLYKDLYTQENCHPLKIIILPLIQIPPWIVLSLSIRKFCAMLPYSNPSWVAVHQEMLEGGFGWITNLTVADPFFILPMSLLAINLTICEVSHNFKPEAVRNTTVSKVLHNGFRLLALGGGCVACFMPSGVVLFWASVSTISLGHMFLTESTKFKTLMKFPLTKQEQPNKYLINDANTVYNKLAERRNKLLQK